MTLVSSNLSPSINFEFEVTASLYGEDGNLFTGSCQISLTESGGSTIYGTTSMQTSTGTAVFSIYFSTLGNKILIASCSSITVNLAIAVSDLSLKITSIAPSVITK